MIFVMRVAVQSWTVLPPSQNSFCRSIRCSGEGTINLLLRELGVSCVRDKDEFDSLNLGNYRHMQDF